MSDTTEALRTRLADLGILSRDEPPERSCVPGSSTSAWLENAMLATDPANADTLALRLPPFSDKPRSISPGTVAWPIDYYFDGVVGVVVVWPNSDASIWHPASGWRFGTWHQIAKTVELSDGSLAGWLTHLRESPFRQPADTWPDWRQHAGSEKADEAHS